MDPLRITAIGLPITAAVADVVAVVVVIAGARDRRAALSFAWMTCVMVLWNGRLALESIPGFATAHPAAVDSLIYPLLLVPATVFHNAFVWSGARGWRMTVVLVSGYAAALVLNALQSRGLITSGFHEYSWGSVPKSGPVYAAFFAYAVVWIGLGFVACTRALKHSTRPEIRLRVKYWLLSATVFAALSSTNFLANWGFPVLPLGSVGNIFFVSVMSYAAVRHRLLDIDVFIMRAAAALLIGVAAVLPVAWALLWMQRLPFGADSAVAVGCMLLAAMVSLLVFSRYRSYVEQEVEGSLFPARRAARQALRQFCRELVKLPGRDDLSRQLTESLGESLGLHGVALYLAAPEIDGFTCVSSVGTIEAPPLPDAGRLTDGASGHDTILVGGPHGGRRLSAVEHRARDLEWEAYVPVRADGVDLGFIALGPKRSHAAIDDSDATLLSMAAAQLAIALQNADYVREIERQKAAIDELRKRLKAENVALRAEVQSASQFREIIGSSIALQRVLALVEQVAPSSASILITGETGTGKELIARALHELSPRRTGPLVSVNCPAIPAGLAESELFGSERGAFTDAIEARPGKFELAHGGTIFLDEVAELSPDIQVKLLRVLQERETQRVGGHKVHKLDLRVIAATNRDLSEELRAHRFRRDLYYRLAAVHVHVPPLRERLEDIPMLASFFLDRAATAYQKPIRGFTASALAALQRYSWPGNIRELQHVVERAVLVCSSEIIQPGHLSDLAVQSAPSQPLRATLEAEKLRSVMDALAQSGGNEAAAARLLGMSRSNLARMMKRLGLKGPPPV